MIYDDFEIGDVLYDGGDGKSQPKYLLVIDKDDYTKFIYCRIGHKNSTSRGYNVDIGGGIIVGTNELFTIVLDTDLGKPRRRGCADYDFYMRSKEISNRLKRVCRLSMSDMYTFLTIKSYGDDYPDIAETVMIKLCDLSDDVKSLRDDLISLEREIKTMQSKWLFARDWLVEECCPSLKKTDAIKLPG